MKELPFPNEIMIEATNVCNNKCFFAEAMQAIENVE